MKRKETEAYLCGYSAGIISKPTENPHAINPYQRIRDREEWYAGYVAGAQETRSKKARSG